MKFSLKEYIINRLVKWRFKQIKDDLDRKIQIIFSRPDALEQKEKYPLTEKALVRFSEKIKSISKLTSKITDESELYPLMILVRSQIEHFIVGHYIWNRNRSEKSDSVAHEYFDLYRTSEFLKQENYNNSLEVIEGKEKEDVIQRIKKYFDNNAEFKVLIDQVDGDPLNNTFVQYIHTIRKRFDIRDIVEYLFSAKGNDDLKINTKMIDLLKEYNYASSFVHGGPTADALTYNEDSPNKKERFNAFKEWSEKMPDLFFIHLMWFYTNLDSKTSNANSD